MQFIQAVTEIRKCGRPIISEQTVNIFKCFHANSNEPTKKPNLKRVHGKILLNSEGTDISV